VNPFEINIFQLDQPLKARAAIRMNQSTPASCDHSPINAYYNNATATPNQSSAALSGSLLGPFLAYAIAGGVASVFNIICILIFITKKVCSIKVAI
jgi:hypothetical protein